MNPEEQVIKIIQLEKQVERLLSDATSEKGTRARVNSEFTRRLEAIESNQRKLERIIYMSMGGLAVLQYILSLPK